MFKRTHTLGARLGNVPAAHLLRGVVLLGSLSLGVGAQETSSSSSTSPSPTPASSASASSTATASPMASATPSATATNAPCPPGQTCNAAGHIKPRLPTNAKLAIAFVCIFTVLLFLSFLFWYLRRNRVKAPDTADGQGTSDGTAERAVTDIEARQMAGPPTVLAATYNPATGSPVYTIGSAGSEEHWTPVAVQTPVGAHPRGMMEMPSGPVAPYTPGGSRAAKYPFVGMGSAGVR